MDVIQAFECIGRVWQRWGNELDQRFGVIRGDLFVGQRRAERFRVRRLCQPTLNGYAQAFALYTMQALLEQGQVGRLAEQVQAAVQKFAQVDVLTRRSPRYGDGRDVLQGRGGA